MGGGRERGRREIFKSAFIQIAMRTGSLQSPISYLLVEFSWEGKSALRRKMYTFLPKCHSTSISFPDSDKRSLFLSKCWLSAPALIIKARSKKNPAKELLLCHWRVKSLSSRFILRCQVPNVLFLYCSLLIKKKINSFYLVEISLRNLSLTQFFLPLNMMI